MSECPFGSGVLVAVELVGPFRAKSGRENLGRDELATYRLLADEYPSLDDAGLKAARDTGTIIEVNCDDQAVQ